MPKSVIVVGAGLGGLSAAIHARLSGFEVLVLEQRPLAGGKAAPVTVGRFQLDPGPSIIILPHIYESVFALAGRRMADYLRFERLDPISRVFMEGEPPLDLPADREECLRTIAQHSPADGPAVRTLLGKLSKIEPLIDATIFRYPFERVGQLLNPKLIRTALPFGFRRTYKQIVDSMFASPMLRAFFYGFPSYGGQSYTSRSIGAFLIPYYMLQDGVWYPEGGVAAIPAAFERLARELGVKFRFESQVAGFAGTASSRVKGVRLSSGEEVEADAVICNADRYTVERWLGREVPEEPSFSYFTLHWALRRPIPSLSHHNLFIPRNFEVSFEELYKRREFPREPIVYLNQTGGSEAANVLAVVTAPADCLWTDTEEFKRRTLASVREAGIAADDVELEQMQTPLTFELRDGSYRGSLYGVDERYRKWGLFPAAIRDSVIRNLFYCGGAVQPGAGLPMVTLSGRFAAEALARQPG